MENSTCRLSAVPADEDRVSQLVDRLKHVLRDSATNDGDEAMPEEFFDCKNDSKLLKDVAESQTVDGSSYNTVTATMPSNNLSTNFEGLHLGINELFIIVQEYDVLKERCHKLETNMASILPYNGSDGHQLDINGNVALEQVNTLHGENQRLADEINVLKKRQKDEEELREALQNTIGRLETNIEELKREILVAADKLSAHDAAAKRAISLLQKEMEVRVEELNKKYESSLSEQDSHIIKISKLESINVELKHANTSFNNKIQDLELEVVRVKNILKMKDTDIAKLTSMKDQFASDIAKLNKRVEVHKEEMEGQEIKTKWAQNKLKSEFDLHKETRKQLISVTNKLQEAKEEGEQIRKNCQEMIERYQGDEEITSVSLRKQLEVEENRMKELEKLNQQQAKELQEQESQLKILNDTTQKVSEQLSLEKANVITTETKNEDLFSELTEREKDCAEMKTTIETLKEEMKELKQLENEMETYASQVSDLKMENEELTCQLADCLNDVNLHKEQQNEMLKYSQNLTESDVLAKASLNELQLKLNKMLSEKEEEYHRFKIREEDLLSKILRLGSEKSSLNNDVLCLTVKLEQKSVALNEISSELEEARNDLKVTKKKNASQLKDLQRELTQTTKKIEQLESNSNGSIDTLSNRSRTSSTTSLEKIGRDSRDSPSYSASPTGSTSPQMSHKVVIPQDHYVTQPNRVRSANVCVEQSVPSEFDKKMVEKICKLQKSLARKNEKVEFLEDHNRQLTEALQNKSKIIQHYFMRQEPGLIAPDKFDDIKSHMSQYGGIMSSVYSAKPTDKAMTLDLSLNINSKLQAVLEDTVLKNITLQDSLNTLGTEIAKFQAAGVTKPP